MNIQKKLEELEVWRIKRDKKFAQLEQEQQVHIDAMIAKTKEILEIKEDLDIEDLTKIIKNLTPDQLSEVLNISLEEVEKS